METGEVNPAMTRLAALVQPMRALPEPEATAARLRQTLELADAGIDMMRLNLRREHPEASQETLDGLLREWLRRRPGAEHGDSWGRPAPERLARL